MAFDFAEYHKKMMERKEETEKEVETFKQTLKDTGLQEFTVQYSGQGDDGEIYDVEIKPGGIIIKNCEWDQWNNKTFKSESYTGERKAEGFIEDFCYDLLEACHAGWEINEGQNGTFTWTSKENEIRHDYQEVYYRDESEGF